MEKLGFTGAYIIFFLFMLKKKKKKKKDYGTR